MAEHDFDTWFGNVSVVEWRAISQLQDLASRVLVLVNAAGHLHGAMDRLLLFVAAAVHFGLWRHAPRPPTPPTPCLPMPPPVQPSPAASKMLVGGLTWP